MYYRRKGNSIVLEGKQDKKSILIWTIPDPDKLIFEILLKSSYLPKEKEQNIVEKINRLDYWKEKSSIVTSDVRLIEFKRTPEKDDKKYVPTQEDLERLWELTK